MNTVTEETPAKQTRLNVGFEAHQGSRGAGEAWKRSIGTKGVPARLEMLPEGESRMGRVGISLVLQVLILGFFVAIPIFFPERLKAVLNQQVVPLAMPVTEIPVAPPPPVVKAKVEPPKPAPVEIKLNPKQPHIFVQQKVLQPKIEKVEAKAPELTPTPVIQSQIVDQSNQPKRPREEVKMAMDTGSAATPTIKAAAKDVQTGGFGDPNGLPGKGDPNKTTNVNRAGLQALPGGPGYGNGTGGDKGARGVVQSSGFGNGTAIQDGGPKKGAVATSGFANQTVADNTPKPKAVESATTPVELLEKPKPVYTEEGRSLKIEGDVALDVVFQANGTVQVSKVVSGLGHGLDEAAVRAAQQIKFKPAKRDNQNVDFPARIRIQFRLAY
ncbi:MAG: energy transducer TonB [Acidobacteria bacterium]|nr:energy transducer TonB [Acidobacteriota bacterium]